MSNSIPLHKEFGVNPTIPICIICRKEKGEIALLGNHYKGEAPKNMLIDIEPCDKCRKKYLEKGVLLVEANVEIKRGKEVKTPNGNIVVLKNTAFKRLFDVNIPKHKIVMVENGILGKLQEET